MPVVIMGRTQGWGKSKIRWIAVLMGFSHSSSTLIIGVIVGILGIQLSEASMNFMKIVAPLVIFIFGIVYLLLGIYQNRNYKHPHLHMKLNNVLNKTGIAAIISLSIGMFFSPCIEIESYFFTASLIGWKGIAIVSITYFIITIVGITCMVELGRKGYEVIKIQHLEEYEKLILGIILIIMAILFYFFINS